MPICSTYAQERSVKIQYAPLKRNQISGTSALILPSHFQYLNVFKKDQRFAPDEPSSFSSIEYFFKWRALNEKTKFKWSLGLFRNHVKGDIILDNLVIHFGRGNSHFGISNSLNFSRNLFKSSWTIELYNQLGIGPLVTRFENDQLRITPEKWGLNGYGISNNLGVNLRSPIFFSHYSISLGTLYNITLTKLSSIETTDSQNQIQRFTDLQYITMNYLPSINISLSYTWVKK